MRYLFAFALVAGCTCFTPVSENPDSGRGGGSAGGSAGGAAGGSAGGSAGGGFVGDSGMGHGDGGCVQPGECVGTPANVPFCGAAGGLGWSCIDNRCLWECNGGRVCDITQTPDGGCLTCATGGTQCRGRFCANNTRLAEVESSTCGLSGAVTITGGAGCRYQASGDAGVVGSFEELQGGEFLADFPSLGGTCTGSGLPTGLERWVFNCPGCQLVVRF